MMKIHFAAWTANKNMNTLKVFVKGTGCENNRGVSIVVVLMVIMTVMMLATVSLKTSSDELDISSHELDSLQAYNAAESGLSHAASGVLNDRDFLGEIDGTFEVKIGEDEADADLKYAYYRAEIMDKSGDGLADLIYSTGIYSGKKRAIMARIISRNPLVLEKPRKVRVN